MRIAHFTAVPNYKKEILSRTYQCVSIILNVPRFVSKQRMSGAWKRHWFLRYRVGQGRRMLEVSFVWCSRSRSKQSALECLFKLVPASVRCPASLANQPWLSCQILLNRTVLWMFVPLIGKVQRCPIFRSTQRWYSLRMWFVAIFLLFTRISCIEFHCFFADLRFRCCTSVVCAAQELIIPTNEEWKVPNGYYCYHKKESSYFWLLHEGSVPIGLITRRYFQ